MRENRIYVVIVIYNKQCEASTTCLCLEKIKGINVIIVDNSTQDNDNKVFAEEHSWTYICMNGNMGLAKAYNKAVEAIPLSQALICLFDDDSQVDEIYFAELERSSREDETASVFLPQVYDKYGLLSPSIINGIKERRAKDIEVITQENVTGINNGMAVRREVYNGYQYDERYFLDYIDHCFIRDMKTLKQKILIMDTKLKHSVFFDETDENFEAVSKRMQIFKRDYSKFCGSSLIGRLEYLHCIFRHKLYFFLKFGKKIKYFFI